MRSESKSAMLYSNGSRQLIMLLSSPIISVSGKREPDFGCLILQSIRCG